MSGDLGPVLRDGGAPSYAPDRDGVLEAVRELGPVGSSRPAQVCGMTPAQVRAALAALRGAGLVGKDGEKRGATYSAATD